MPTLEQLRDEVNRGSIDTVLTVFPDLYGRLMGKRITGAFFLEKTAGEGMEACDYLLACDMEMDPVPGYRFASWETGYGDFHAVPALGTSAAPPGCLRRRWSSAISTGATTRRWRCRRGGCCSAS